MTRQNPCERKGKSRSTARPRSYVREKKQTKKNLCEAQPGHVEPLMASKRQEWMLQLK